MRVSLGNSSTQSESIRVTWRTYRLPVWTNSVKTTQAGFEWKRTDEGWIDTTCLLPSCWQKEILCKKKIKINKICIYLPWGNGLLVGIRQRKGRDRQEDSGVWALFEARTISSVCLYVRRVRSVVCALPLRTLNCGSWRNSQSTNSTFNSSLV